MTYWECRQDGRTIWIGPFAKAMDARAWLKRHEGPYRLRSIQLHERRAKVLHAAYELGETSRCVGVFEDTALALAAAGKKGVVIDWRRDDCLAADDPLPLQRLAREPARPAVPASEPEEADAHWVASPVVSRDEHLAESNQTPGPPVM